MRGEFSIDVKSVDVGYADFVRPQRFSYDTNGVLTNELKLTDENGEFLFLCGRNDWAYLALEIINPIKEEAKNIVKEVCKRKEEDKNVTAVALGKNDKRIMDIYFGGKDKCNRICGLPVVVTNNQDELSFLVKKVIKIPF